MNKQIIFCVDDENIVLQSIKTELISMFGYDDFVIETAESGSEALEIFSELLNNRREVPVFISDYIMPGMKGDELLALVHQLSPSSLTVMLTGQAKIEGITNAINHANLFRYLEKPWKKDELKQTIGTALECYRQNKTLTVEYDTQLQTMTDLTAQIGKVEETKEENSNNLLFFKEITISLHKIKTNMDLLAGKQKDQGLNINPPDLEVEEECYRSSQVEIERITAIINRLKAGRQ